MADENNNLLTVKEYDKIYIKSKAGSDSNKLYLKDEYFQEIESFLKDCEPDDSDFDEENSNDSIRDFFTLHNDYIQVKNYVGIIQLGSGYQIEILPKIDFFNESDKNNQNTKEVFLNMLECLDDYQKVFSASNLDIEDMSIFEIFIKLFIEEVKKLFKQGLKSSYITKEDNINFFKGKFLISEQIKYNLCHKERFYMSFDEFDLNRPENKLIKATLLKLQRLTTNWDNSKEIKLLLNDFETIEESINYEKDLAKVILDRNTISYEKIMQWVQVFLFNKTFTSFHGENNSRALLFNMNKLFEDYVAYHIRNIANDWNVSTQGEDGKTMYIFEQPQKFLIKPDIFLRKKDNEDEVVILDTKWKRLDKKKDNYGISLEDMYQMYAYSKKYNAENIWLLYPYNKDFDLEQIKDSKHVEIKNEDNKEKKEIYYIEYKEFKEDNKSNNSNNTTVRVFFVDVAEIDKKDNSNSLKSLCAIIGEL